MDCIDIKELIKHGERLDDLHRNGYFIIQNPKRFCFGIDAVILSEFAKVRPGENVIDLGTGTGVIPILLAGRTVNDAKDAHFTGLELQPESCEMAQRSVIYNKLCQRIDIVCGDIKQLPEPYAPSSFDVAVSNPPYVAAGSGITGAYSPKAIARHEILCTLDDVVKGASRLIKTGGRFYMVHRPYRLADIVTALRLHKLEPKKLRFVHSDIHKEPSMVLIEAVRGGRPDLKVLPPLIIYNDNGTYTDEIFKIYYS